MNKEQLFDVVVATIKVNRSAVISTIRKNGIPLSANATDDQIFSAFVSLVNTSAKFREEFANIVKTTEKRVASATPSTLSANGTGFNRELTSAGNSSAQDSNWKDYLGQVFTPEVTSNLVNNLFGLFSGKSPNEATDELRNADFRFQNQEPPKKGLSTGAIVGISVGVIALIGLTIYLIRK
jgi:ABC-type transporter Mla subunit MlaD